MKRTHQGFLTVELLIATSLFALIMTGVFLVASGGQTAALDVGLSRGGVGRTLSSIQQSARDATSRSGFLALADIPEYADADDYYQQQIVEGISPCVKTLTRETFRGSEYGRTLTVSLSTIVASLTLARDLGSDCVVLPPPSAWENPQRFASDTLSPGKSTAIDALRKIAYLGGDKEPYLYIADARNAVLGQTSGMMIGANADSYDNGFNSDGKSLDRITDIDTAYIQGKTYAFVTTASTTAQVAVIDVSNVQRPVLLAKRSLAGVTATDATAWGWRIFYNAGRVYVTARETAGPELHVFSVSTPTNPTELGSKELNTTVNDFVVSNGLVYAADESDTFGEIRTYDTTNASSIVELTGAATNLSGNQNGYSISLIGTKLYFGRQSTTLGHEFYIFDARNPASLTSGYPVLGSKEIGADVLDVDIAERFAFLVTGKTNEEFQVWNVSSPTNINLVKKYNFGNIVAGGADYETDYVYATGDATPNFQMLYGGPPLNYTLAHSGNITVTAGQSRNVTITATRTSGSQTNVAFTASGLPAGATPTFTNSPCLISCNSTLTIQTTIATPPGTYPITITGAPGGQDNAQATFTLTVTAPFTYTLAPASANMNVSKQASNGMQIFRNLVSGATQSVSISAVYTPALPASQRFDVTYANQAGSPGSPCTGTCIGRVNVAAKQQTPSGVYTFTVTGVSAGVSDQTTTFTVTVP